MTRDPSVAQQAQRQSRTEVVLAGVGGQGLVYIGRLLGEALVHDGFHAVQTQSYGVASRGGFTKSEVVFSSEPLAYPMVCNPDAVLALTEEAYRRYCCRSDEVLTLLYDSDAVPNAPSGANRAGFPLTSTARRLGMMGSYNLLALGAFMKFTGLVSPEQLLRILKMSSDSDRGRQNLQAFEKGLSLAE